MNILFIGNSYTFFNKMPETLEALARSAGLDVTVMSVTKGGYTLEQLASDENEHGARVSAMLMGDVKFDRIILQEQSVRPAASRDAFFGGVEAMLDKIHKYQAGAEVVLYETWGRKAGHAVLAEHGWTTEEMYALLHESYSAAARKFGLRVSPVGAAFERVRRERPDIELYANDLTHPSPEGSYLAACVHYAAVIGASPENAAYCGDIDAGIAEYMRQVAREISLQK